jgi:hypothetical protein
MGTEPQQAPRDGVGSPMSWWKKFLLSLVAIILWTVCLILAGDSGHAGQYFWASEGIAAVSFAAAPFWYRRASVWYWPTVVVLIIIHFAAMYVKRDYVALGNLPPRGIFVGLFTLDVMTCWLLMVGTAYLFDRKFPWSR